MAKNNDDEFDLSDNGSDDSFLDDDGDFDFDSMDMDLEKRDTSVVGIAKDALKESFMPEGIGEKAKIIKDSIKRTLPSKIKGEADDFENLYDKVSDSISSNVELLGKDLKQLGSKVDKLLPKDGMFRELFNKIYEREESREAELSEAQRKEQEILQNTTEALGDLAQVQQQTSLRDNVLADKRTSSTNDILKLIAQDTNATKLLGYEYSAKYYKKSLELQFRTVSLLKDTLEANKTSYKEMLTQLLSISKNTSLPDIVKQRNMEMISAGIKGKLRDMALNKAFGEGSLFDSIGKKITGRISELTQQTRDYISSGDALMDTVGDFLGDDMMDPKAMAAGMGADFIRDKAADGIMGKMLNKVFSSKMGRKLAFGIKSFHDDPSTALAELAQNRAEKGGIVNKFLSKIFGEASDLTKIGHKDRNANLRRLDLNTAATLDVRTKISINQVIPGYLRMMHAEIRASRLKMDSPDVKGLEQWYDYDREKFRTMASMQAGFKGMIQGKMRTETKSARNNIRNAFSHENIKNALGNDSFTDEELKAIEKAATIGVSKNNVGGMKFFESKEFLSALPEDVRERIRGKLDKVKDHLTNDDNEGWLYDNIRYGVSSLRSSVPAFEKAIEREFRNGNVGYLKNLGLVKYNRDTGEYELDKKALAKMQYDQFGDHEHIMGVEDSNKINVRETYKAGLNKAKESTAKAKEYAGKAYDSFIPESMKKDIERGKAFVKGKIDTGIDFAKNKGMNAFNTGRSFLSDRMSGGIANYFTSGRFKEDIFKFGAYIRDTLIPKFKSMLKNFGELVLKHIPQWIKDKYKAVIEKFKGKANDTGNALLDRLEPDEQATVLEIIANVKKIKLSTIERTAIDTVKKAKQYIENFDADSAYLKTKGFIGNLFSKGKEGSSNMLKAIKDEAGRFKELKDKGMKTSDIIKYRAEDVGKSLKDLAVDTKNKITDKASPYLEKAGNKISKFAKIGYHLSLSREQRAKLEEMLDKHIVKNWSKAKQKIIELVPDKLKKFIAETKDGMKAIKEFRKWRETLPAEERANVDAELYKFLYSNESKLTNALKNGGFLKTVGELGLEFKDKYLNKETGTASVTSAPDLTTAKEERRESLERVAMTAEDVSNAIHAIREAAKTYDAKVIANTVKELEETRPGISKNKDVKRAIDEALDLAGQAADAGDELVAQFDKEKDGETKAGMFGSIMSKAWGYVPMGGMLKMGFKGMGFIGKAMWNIEKFMWRNVYSKLLKAPFKAAWWVMNKTILTPIKKIGGWIGKKTGLNKLFGGLKNLFKGGFFKNIAKGAGTLAAGLGGLFGKKKRMINGELVEEGAHNKKDKKGGGLFGLLKSMGGKLLMILGPLFGIFTKLFKGGGKGFLSIGKFLGKGLFKILRHTLPKLLGGAFSGVGKFLKNMLGGTFKLISKGIMGTFSSIGSLLTKGVDAVKDGASSLWNWAKDGVSSLWNKGKEIVNKGVNVVKEGAKSAVKMIGRVGEWVMQGLNKAKEFCKKLTKAMYENIVKYIDKFTDIVKTKLGSKIGKKVGEKGVLKIVGNVLGKIAFRLAPIGTAMLAYDVGCIALMCLKGMSLGSAVSMQFIGIDIFSDGDEGELKEDVLNGDGSGSVESYANANPGASSGPSEQEKANLAKDQDSPSGVDGAPAPTASTSEKGSELAKKASDIADENSNEKSQGRCAQYVRQSLASAGYKEPPGRPTSAYQYATTGFIEKYGFERLKVDNPLTYTPQKGDISITNRFGKHEHGHIAIYDGKNWNSDFKQKSISIYSDLPSGKAGDYISVYRDTRNKGTMPAEGLGGDVPCGTRPLKDNANNAYSRSLNPTRPTSSSKPVSTNVTVNTDHKDLMAQNESQFKQATEISSSSLEEQKKAASSLDEIKCAIGETNKLLNSLLSALQGKNNNTSYTSAPINAYDINK